MDSVRATLLLVLLFFLFIAPDPHQLAFGQLQQEDSSEADKEVTALGVISSSYYGDFDPSSKKWLNLTGLRENDGFAWGGLNAARRVGREQVEAVLGEQGSKWLDWAPAGESHNVIALQEDIPIYRNVTGIVTGDWVRSKIFDDLIPPHVNITALMPGGVFTTSDYRRNITGSHGKVQIRLDEKTGEELKSEHGQVREIAVTMSIKDEKSSGDGWEVKLQGVHFPALGGIVLTTASDKFYGIYALPHFTLSRRSYILAQQLLNKTLSDAITEQQSRSSLGHTHSWLSFGASPSEMVMSAPSCEIIVWLQQHPVSLTSLSSGPALSPRASDILKLIEDELRCPIGAPVPKAPKLTMSAVIFSPDCGFLLESKGPPRYPPQEGLHLQGLKLESHLRLAKRYSALFGLICAAQTWLLIRQMKEASTPSTVSRVSIFTIAAMAMGDGFACMIFLTVALFVDAAFLSLITTAFLASMGVSFFGMKFLIDIWTVQAPERRARQRRNNIASLDAQGAVDAPTSSLTNPGDGGILPLPVTARQTNTPDPTPIILPPDQDIDAAAAEDAAATQTAGQATTTNTSRREAGALYTRFYLLLLGLIFLSLQATSWPTALRSAYTNALGLTYLSFWTPQIHRNVMRNCRKALRWEFVLGQSLLRLAPLLYLYTVPNNVIFVDPAPGVAYLFAGWVWIQVCALLGQELLGPRFFVPAGFAPPAYDYHPILREDDLESGWAMMPIGFEQTAAGGADSGRAGGSAAEGARDKAGVRSWDCAICMQTVDVPVLPSGGGGVGAEGGAGIGPNFLARRAYMVTPCRHVFHSRCLEGWMRYRLQCPICRDALVPL